MQAAGEGTLRFALGGSRTPGGAFVSARHTRRAARGGGRGREGRGPGAAAGARRGAGAGTGRLLATSAPRAARARARCARPCPSAPAPSGPPPRAAPADPHGRIDQGGEGGVRGAPRAVARRPNPGRPAARRRAGSDGLPARPLPSPTHPPPPGRGCPTWTCLRSALIRRCWRTSCRRRRAGGGGRRAGGPAPWRACGAAAGARRALRAAAHAAVPTAPPPTAPRAPLSLARPARWTACTNAA
jgi:hypothetical protein